MAAAITVRQVTKSYGGGTAAVQALGQVSLEVAAGEILVMMGPSGSGKTTLLSIMGVILRPSSGTVLVAGHDVTALPERELPGVRLRHIGFVFQGFNLFPALTAAENVAIALDLRGERRPAALTRAKDALASVGLGDKADALPANLSGGQKQRVAIARALVGDPTIILADEPTAALDSHSGKLVMDLITRLAREQQRAVVIVTHDNRTLGYADRIVHIEDGRLREDDARARGRAKAGLGPISGRPTREWDLVPFPA
jgi:putative ABC transport system ATP-binding protein